MKITRALVVVAGLVLSLGLILAAAPTHAGSVSCGSALTGARTGTLSDAQLADQAASIDQALLAGDGPQTSVVSQCQSAVTVHRAISFPLVGVGALALVGVAVAMQGARPRVAVA